MKNKKFWIILLFCIFLLFGWAIWTAFLTDVIPRHRTYFGSYDSFRSKASRSRLAMQLPESVWDIKYYWSVDRFVHVAGYGMSLSEEDYEKWKVQTLERYGCDGTITTEVRYLYSENSEKICVQEEWIKRYGVGNIDALLLEGESLNTIIHKITDMCYGYQLNSYSC